MMQNRKLFTIKMRASASERHISGAEGIFFRDKIQTVVSDYIQRAFEHARGKPDEINIKIEVLNDEPIRIHSLDVITVSNSSEEDARKIIKKTLLSLGVSEIALEGALNIVYEENRLRGSAVVTIDSSTRLEPDKERGIRVKSIGITVEANNELSKKLDRFNLNNHTVREALVLASKVASHEDVVAELCISDDPDYTTGYIASSKTGYIRIPCIKEEGSNAGGRVFFIQRDVSIGKLFDYFEKTPVMIDTVSDIRGEVSADEFFSSISR